MILLIDNYDSFTYNLVQMLGGLGCHVKTVRNDEITIEEIEQLKPDQIILSPGPGFPKDAGICTAVIRKFKEIPILGVCLGHQAICEAYGMKITHARNLMHGKQSEIEIDNKDAIFTGMPAKIKAARYHSLIAADDTLPDCLKVIAKDPKQEEIMAVSHKEYPVYGLQFHPESILTPQGEQIIRNFLKISNKQGDSKMIAQAIHKLMSREEISYDMTKQVMDEIMKGEASEVQIASFLTALSMQGETVENITACAAVMREHCTSFNPETDVIDIVGTGGDEAFTFNISTVASFVVAAAGVPVAKHGNRSVSSKCGAADVLEELGVVLNLSGEQNKQVLKECGMCFMFAPTYHSSMKYAAPVRKELGVRTIFNILGPLANPAGASLQLLGVYDEELVMPLAKVLSNLGVKRALVVHGKDGLDEVTLCDDSVVCEVDNGSFNSYILNPEDLGLKKCQAKDLLGGDPAENARIARAILSGEQGPKRDIVILNAAFSIYLGIDGIMIEDAVKIATEMLDSGKAKAQMERFCSVTQKTAKIGESA